MFTLVFDIFIMCFVLSLEKEEGYSRSLFPSTVAAAAAGVTVAVVVAVAVVGCCWGGGGGGREEEVSLGVIITNTEIKFHILLFTLH